MTKKSKKVSKRTAMRQVFHGKRNKAGRLTASDLKMNKRGKIVSKKASARTKRVLNKWHKAVQKARKHLGITGFVAIKRGTKLYNKAREYYK